MTPKETIPFGIGGMKPKVIIATGLGINSHEELCHAFINAGAQVEFKHLNELLEKPKLLHNYQMGGLAGGFMMGDQLGAGQSTRNRIDGTEFKDILEEKLADPNFPMYITCNSLQMLAKLNLFPIKIGTVRNVSGKHETTSWDMKVNTNNDSVWLKTLKDYSLPIFVPISHGEGRIIVPPEYLPKLKEMNLIAFTYFKGHMCEYFHSSRGERYNPNGSTEDIAAFAWKNNLVPFPHFERILQNFQREDKALLQTKQIPDRIYSTTPKGLYEPTYVMFRDAVNFIK